VPSIVNPFDSTRAAQHYAKGRPHFHAHIAHLLRGSLGLQSLLHRALDVGCGTGLSTVALTQIAQSVVGIDVSLAMLKQADPHPGVHYLRAIGEVLPFANASFDLATVSSAFHWLNPERFFPEVRRILGDGGVLAVYENGFRGELAEVPDFREYIYQTHLPRYPTPPRGTLFHPNTTPPPGFILHEGIPYENQVAMTHEQLVAYLLTQSNVLSVWNANKETPEQTQNLVRAQTAPFFTAPDGKPALRHALFRGVVWVLKTKE
jgi:SAM-dependent methyltransferase